jgi:hypothetical protein
LAWQPFDSCLGLKLSGRQVIVGYANQQLLAAGAAFADVLCSGNFLNTRSFSVGKFYLTDEESMSRRATWFYRPQAYSEFKIACLDLAKRREGQRKGVTSKSSTFRLL